MLRWRSARTSNGWSTCARSASPISERRPTRCGRPAKRRCGEPSRPRAFENGRLIAEFECDLPAETVADLSAMAEPPRIRLLWRPPLLKQLDFQISLVAVLLGLLGLAS